MGADGFASCALFLSVLNLILLIILLMKSI